MSTPTPPADIEITVEPSLRGVSADEWNALIPVDDPFTDHAFLCTLETSGSVGRDAGWLPVHILARRSGRLVGAVPLYLKNHSYGEYIFDWGWAEAAQRAGLHYYPKLVSAVPFTPATSRRLLTGPGPLDTDIATAMVGALASVARTTKAQSIHLLFITQAEHQFLGQIQGFTPRTTHQFHWQNDGYTDFGDWLSRFRSRRRKEVRRERRLAAESGADVRVIPGQDLTEQECMAMRHLYECTIQKKGAQPYLTEDFFSRLRADLAQTSLVLLAESKGEPVAGALTFQRGRHLYGRYWGCTPGWESLHFELCYHLPISLCIQHGWTRFEAGAQGIHKIQRGLLPARTYSAHLLGHLGLAEAVREATEHETQMIDLQIAQLTKQGPFHRA